MRRLAEDNLGRFAIYSGNRSLIIRTKFENLWRKLLRYNLTLEEAAAYSGIGINKLRDLTREQNCRFVLWAGNKRLIKCRLFGQYIEQAYSI